MTDPPNGDSKAVDVSGFVEKSIALPTQAAETARSLGELRIRDARWRLDTRPKIGWTIIGLLFFQNLALAVAIVVAAAHGGLKDLGPIVIGVTAATLGETAAIVQIVVKWLFSEIDYRA